MPIEWAIILVIAVSDAILLAATSFRLEASPQLKILADLIPLAVAFVICRRWRTFPRITERLAHLIGTLFSLALFGSAMVILSFILTGILPLPRWDGAFVTADRMLGLNWLEMYYWLARHPAIEAFAHAAYNSLGEEMLILLIALELLGHHKQARAFVLWFMVSAVATVAIGTLIPAAGPVVYYHLSVASTARYVSQMADLRNGTLRTINPLENQGLVVLPSFHTVLAVLCAYAAWPLRIVKIPLLALNLLIILSCPAEGGHYFIDLIAGIIVAALTISLPGYIVNWRSRKYIRHAEAPVFASK